MWGSGGVGASDDDYMLSSTINKILHMNINMELVKMLQTRQPPTLAVWVASLCEIMLSMMSPTNKILSPTVFGQWVCDKLYTVTQYTKLLRKDGVVTGFMVQTDCL